MLFPGPGPGNRIDRFVGFVRFVRFVGAPPRRPAPADLDLAELVAAGGAPPAAVVELLAERAENRHGSVLLLLCDTCVTGVTRETRRLTESRGHS